MKNRLNYILYPLIWMFLMFISLFLKPHSDDYEFLYYFKNNAWDANGYTWVNDCILLPRNYWRPIEDILFTFEAHYPFLYPYFHHMLIVTLCVIAGYLVFKLGGVLHLKKSVKYSISLFLMFATTSMGTTLDIGGFIQVLATVCGLASILIWIRGTKCGYVIWFILCAIACFCKETGFVWFPIAPLFAAFLKVKNLNLNIFQKDAFFSVLKTCSVACIGIFVYLLLYISVSPRNIGKVATGSEKNTTENVITGDESKTLFSTDVNTHSYKFTPAAFAKNVFVCWGAAIFPIDTTAIYQKNYTLLGITVLLSIYPFILIMLAMLHYIKKHSFSEWFLLLMMLVCVSSVSLVLRAGEISPYPNLAIMALILGIFFNDYQWKRKRIIALVMFILSTIIVDAHKYYMCYWAAEDASQIGKKIKSETKDASNVLLIQYGDWELKKDGAFVRNLIYDFFEGGAAVAEYNYKAPNRMKVIKYGGMDVDSLKLKADSTALANKQMYSAIWIVSENEITVINKK